MAKIWSGKNHDGDIGMPDVGKILLEKEPRMSEDTDIRASLEKGERSLSNSII